MGPYDLALLGELHYPDGLLTEYWAHAAAIIPVETFPYFRDAMDAYREKYDRHHWVEGNRDVISGVLERIRTNGATASRHFERPDGPAPRRGHGMAVNRPGRRSTISGPAATSWSPAGRAAFNASTT